MPKIETSWDLPNNDAAKWAKNNAAKLVKDVSPETAQAIADDTSNWILSGGDFRALVKSIENYRDIFGRILGKQRAESIARKLSTTTYSYANAEKLISSGFAKPLLLPPACDECRCYHQPWFAQDDDNYKGFRWLTANDEHVCTTPIQTPWGVVNGCKDLHNIIVSEGPYLGKHIDEIKVTLTMGQCPHCGKGTPIKKFRCEHCKEIIDDTYQKTIDEFVAKELNHKKPVQSNIKNWIITGIILFIVIIVLLFAK